MLNTDPANPADPANPSAIANPAATVDPVPVPSAPTPSTYPLRPTRPRLRRAGQATAIAVAAIALFAAGIGVDRTGILPGSPSAAPPAPISDLALIDQAWNLIHEDYVDRAHLNDKDLAYAAIRAIADAVGDTGHTTFQTPQDLAAERAALNGKYVGIGAILDENADSHPIIGGVFPDSPAEKAGLGDGDQIVAIDGKPADNLTLDEIGGLIRGPEGTDVTLTIRSVGQTTTRDVKLARAQITIPVVEWAMVPGTKVADIRLGQFSQGATEAMKKAIEASRAAGATSIILDLRHNTGGLVDEAIGVASQFVGSGVVYIEEDADGTKKPIQVKPGGEATSTPLAVLVDHSTASASEIVAGAIQDAKRGTIVGETTFGTGTVLAQYMLADGSALRIGTIQWLTPSGRQIWHHGIDPDVKSALAQDSDILLPADLKKLTAAQLTASKDVQLRAAVTALEGGH